MVPSGLVLSVPVLRLILFVLQDFAGEKLVCETRGARERRGWLLRSLPERGLESSLRGPFCEVVFNQCSKNRVLS